MNEVGVKENGARTGDTTDTITLDTDNNVSREQLINLNKTDSSLASLRTLADRRMGVSGMITVLISMAGCSGTLQVLRYHSEA